MKQLFYNNASRNRLRSNKAKKSLLQLCRVYQVVAFYQKTMRNRFNVLESLFTRIHDRKNA